MVYMVPAEAVIYRVVTCSQTQNPGHVMCYNATVPTEKYEPGPADQDWFQWLLHPRFDEWAK